MKKTNKLQIKDLVTIGIYTAIYFMVNVIVMVCSAGMDFYAYYFKSDLRCDLYAFNGKGSKTRCNSNYGHDYCSYLLDQRRFFSGTYCYI